MMIIIAAAFPQRIPPAATNIVLHLSNVAQSLLLSSLPLPLPLPPVVKEGGLLLLSSMSMHHHHQGPGMASLPAQCSGRRPPTPMLFRGGGGAAVNLGAIGGKENER